jgi:hypothetical protein
MLLTKFIIYVISDINVTIENIFKCINISAVHNQIHINVRIVGNQDYKNTNICYLYHILDVRALYIYSFISYTGISQFKQCASNYKKVQINISYHNYIISCA